MLEWLPDESRGLQEESLLKNPLIHIQGAAESQTSIGDICPALSVSFRLYRVLCKRGQCTTFDEGKRFQSFSLERTQWFTHLIKSIESPRRHAMFHALEIHQCTRQGSLPVHLVQGNGSGVSYSRGRQSKSGQNKYIKEKQDTQRDSECHGMNGEL